MNTEARTCPCCRLVNPPEAEACDCGYNFASGQGGMERPSVVREFIIYKEDFWIALCFIVSGLILMGHLLTLALVGWSRYWKYIGHSFLSKNGGFGILALMVLLVMRFARRW
jgi:hypothetical protein